MIVKEVQATRSVNFSNSDDVVKTDQHKQDGLATLFDLILRVTLQEMFDQIEMFMSSSQGLLKSYLSGDQLILVETSWFNNNDHVDNK